MVAKSEVHGRERNKSTGVRIGKEVLDELQMLSRPPHIPRLPIEIAEIAVAGITIRIDQVASQKCFFRLTRILQTCPELSETAIFHRLRVLRRMDEGILRGGGGTPIFTVLCELHTVGQSQLKFRVTVEQLSEVAFRGGIILLAMGDDGEPVLGVQGVRIEPAGALESCPGIVEMISGELDASAEE